MSFETTIRDLTHDADNLMAAGEPVKNARKQFELETLRSLILVDESGPIGLLTRSKMSQIPDSDLDRPARDFAADVPTLSQSLTLAQARPELGAVEFDADRIPVVNDDGHFVGVVDREAVMREAETIVAGRGAVVVGGRRYSIEIGMSVLGADENKLGKIDEIILERSRVASFTIAHGLFGRHHKRLTADHITNVNGDTVYVDFGKTEFRFLADVEELEEDSVPMAAS